MHKDISCMQYLQTTGSCTSHQIISCSVIISACNRVSGFCTTITFSSYFPGFTTVIAFFKFFIFTHFILQKLAYYRYKVFCYHTSFSVGLFALHKLHKFKEKLHTTLLIHTMNYDTEYVCFHQTKEVYVSSCIAYSVKA